MDLQDSRPSTGDTHMGDNELCSMQEMWRGNMATKEPDWVDMMFADTEPADVVKEAPKPKQRRITVMVNMDHVAHYGHKDTMMELTYGCDFEVKVGDSVECPPSNYWPKYRTGVVTALDPSGYEGPVKNVRKPV